MGNNLPVFFIYSVYCSPNFSAIIFSSVPIRCIQNGTKNGILIFPKQLCGYFGLTPLGKRILKKLDEQKNRGLQLKEITEPGVKTELRNPVPIDKVVAPEDDIYFSADKFNDLTKRVLDGLTPGTSFSIPEVKGKKGLPRKYMIPLLNMMEEKGMVKCVGDCRVVCRDDSTTRLLSR